MAFEYVDYERMYFSPNDVKDEGDVRRERAVTLLAIIFFVALAVGVPLFVNIGKTLFEIPPVIY